MMISLEIFPSQLKTLAQHIANFTSAIETNVLQNKVTTDILSLVPGGLQLDQDAINACEIAIKACQLLEGIGDNAGIKGRLQRLGSDLLAMQHSNQHGFSYYLQCFEAVFHDLFGKLDS